MAEKKPRVRGNVEAVGRFTWEREVLRGADLGSTARSIAAIVASYATTTTGRDAHPGIGRLVEDSGKSEKTVRRALEECRQAGVLHRAFHTKGRGRADEYWLTLPPISEPSTTGRETGHGHWSNSDEPPAAKLVTTTGHEDDHRSSVTRPPVIPDPEHRSPVTTHLRSHLLIHPVSGGSPTATAHQVPEVGGGTIENNQAGRPLGSPAESESAKNPEGEEGEVDESRSKWSGMAAGAIERAECEAERIGRLCTSRGILPHGPEIKAWAREVLAKDPGDVWDLASAELVLEPTGATAHPDYFPAEFIEHLERESEVEVFPDFLRE